MIERTTTEEMKKLMREVESVQADIVYCKDCKRWDNKNTEQLSPSQWNGNKGLCKNTTSYTSFNDYCSYGKRRSE